LKEEVTIEKKKDTFPLATFFSDMLRGGCVGSVSVTAVTPVMNFTNHILAKQGAQSAANLATKFTLRRAFDGVLSYNASVVPMIGISLSLNTFFMTQARKQGYERDDVMKLGFATAAGMTAGMVGALPEGIAQAQQLSTPKPGALSVVRSVVRENGFFALTRGIGPTMPRQATFTLGYMGLMPYFTAHVREKIDNPLIADLFSASICGLIVGPATAPWNTLRFERQKNFEKTGPASSYSSIVREAFAPTSKVNLMAGWRPRTLMSACSMFLLHKGKELYDQASSEQAHVKHAPW